MRYCEQTRAAFAALPQEVTGEIVSQGFPENIVVNGHEYLRKYISRDRFYAPTSVYYISRDGGWLLRISDHWSSGSKGRNCKRIRYCYWTLAKNTIKPIRGYVGGVVRTNEIRFNDRLR